MVFWTHQIGYVLYVIAWKTQYISCYSVGLIYWLEPPCCTTFSDTLGFNVSTLPRRSLVNILLFGKEGIPDEKNFQILNFVVDFIIKSKRLDLFGGEGGIS